MTEIRPVCRLYPELLTHERASVESVLECDVACGVCLSALLWLRVTGQQLRPSCGCLEVPGEPTDTVFKCQTLNVLLGTSTSGIGQCS